MRSDLLTFLIMFAVVSFLPIIFHGNLPVMHILIMSLIWGVVAIAWDFLVGYAGIFAFAQVAFFTIGAYASAMLTVHLGISPYLGILAGGGVITALVGVLIGLPCLRLKGPYVALLTFGFHMILEPLFKSDAGRAIGTGGREGLVMIPPLAVGGYTYSSLELVPWFYTIMGVSFVLLFAIYKVIHSPWGLAFVALRSAEPFAKSLGVDDIKYKLIVFSISASITGIIGGFYAHYVGVLSTRILGLDLFLLLMIMQVVGGMGRFPGALIGAFMVTFFNEGLRVVGIYRLPILGAAVIGILRFMPDGVMGVLSPVSGVRPVERFRRFIRRTPREDLRKKRC